MHTRFVSTSVEHHSSAASWGRCFLMVAFFGFTSCQDSAVSTENGLGDTPGNTPLEAGDTLPSIAAPARVSDAAAALDLSRLALLPGAENPSERTVTGLVYRATGQPEHGFKFHQAQLIADGWKELPGASVTPQYASAVFVKRGLHLAVMTIPGPKEKVDVTLKHCGNITFGKLPMPHGAKVIYDGPSSAIFAVESPVGAAASEIASALKHAGWEPYGAAEPVQWFKQNAVKLAVMTTAAPAQGGKATINVSSEMLPVDVPVPAAATDVQFNSSRKRLTFHVYLSQGECLAFYRESLGKLGWRSTMEAPAKIDLDQVIIFQTSAKDILRLGMRGDPEGKLRVFAEHLSAAEIEEMNRKLDAQAEAYKAAKSGAAKGQ